MLAKLGDVGSHSCPIATQSQTVAPQRFLRNLNISPFPKKHLKKKSNNAKTAERHRRTPSSPPAPPFRTILIPARKEQRDHVTPRRTCHSSSSSPCCCIGHRSNCLIAKTGSPTPLLPPPLPFPPPLPLGCHHELLQPAAAAAAAPRRRAPSPRLPAGGLREGRVPAARVPTGGLRQGRVSAARVRAAGVRASVPAPRVPAGGLPAAARLLPARLRAAHPSEQQEQRRILARMLGCFVLLLPFGCLLLRWESAGPTEKEGLGWGSVIHFRRRQRGLRHPLDLYSVAVVVVSPHLYIYREETLENASS